MNFLSEFFQFKASKTTLRNEVVGGVTTFVTMAYIVAVNPGILSQAMGGELFEELVFATCISSAIACLLMGLLANYPFALAPGMGLNAFFAYGVVMGMGVRWDLALSVVLAAGILFTLLSVMRAREIVINAVPASLKHATAAGIGLFIAFIGLKNAGVVAGDDATLVTLGELQTGSVGMALVGILVTGVLLARGMKGAILIGVAVITVLSMAMGVSPLPEGVVSLPTWPSTLFGRAFDNLGTAFHPALVDVVVAFLFVDLFDTMGTLMGLAEQSGRLDEEGKLPRANRALLSDSIATMVGAVFGTSPVTTYIESASGISEGARTGLANVVVAVLFLLALFVTPLVKAIPIFATAPALVLVGVLMIGAVQRIAWKDMSDALPAFMTMLVMPLTFSIAHGVAAGVVTYPIVKRLSGRSDEVHPLMDLLAVIFIAKFIFLP